MSIHNLADKTSFPLICDDVVAFESISFALSGRVKYHGCKREPNKLTSLVIQLKQ